MSIVYRNKRQANSEETTDTHISESSTPTQHLQNHEASQSTTPANADNSALTASIIYKSASQATTQTTISQAYMYWTVNEKPRLRYRNQRFILKNKNETEYVWYCSRRWREEEEQKCIAIVYTDPSFSYLYVRRSSTFCTHNHDLNDSEWQKLLSKREICAYAACTERNPKEGWTCWKLCNFIRQRAFKGWGDVKSLVYRQNRKINSRPPYPKSKEEFRASLNTSDHRWTYSKFIKLKTAKNSKFFSENKWYTIIPHGKPSGSIFSTALKSIKNNNIHSASVDDLRMRIMDKNKRIATLKVEIEQITNVLTLKTIPSTYDQLFYQGGNDLFETFFTKRLVFLLSTFSIC